MYTYIPTQGSVLRFLLEKLNFGFCHSLQSAYGHLKPSFLIPTPSPEVSIYNLMIILFFSKVTGLAGVIESPNFPDPYPHNRNCTWTIEAPRGNKINASFSHFEIENPHYENGGCAFDFIKLWET